MIGRKHSSPTHLAFQSMYLESLREGFQWSKFFRSITRLQHTSRELVLKRGELRLLYNHPALCSIFHTKVSSLLGFTSCQGTYWESGSGFPRYGKDSSGENSEPVTGFPGPGRKDSDGWGVWNLGRLSVRTRIGGWLAERVGFRDHDRR